MKEREIWEGGLWCLIPLKEAEINGNHEKMYNK